MTNNIVYQLGVETETGISFKKVSLVSQQGLATAEYLQSLRYEIPAIKRGEAHKLSFTSRWDNTGGSITPVSLYCFLLSFDAHRNTVVFSWRKGLCADCYSVVIDPHSLLWIYRNLKQLSHHGLSNRTILRIVRKSNPFAPIRKVQW